MPLSKAPDKGTTRVVRPLGGATRGTRFKSNDSESQSLPPRAPRGGGTRLRVTEGSWNSWGALKTPLPRKLGTSPRGAGRNKMSYRFGGFSIDQSLVTSTSHSGFPLPFFFRFLPTAPPSTGLLTQPCTA